MKKRSNKILEFTAIIITAVIILAIAVVFYKVKYGQSNDQGILTNNQTISESNPVLTVKVYAYCSCKICNAQWVGMVSTGQTMAEIKEKGLSICAADPTVLPYGTIIKYDEKEYYVTDCGAAIKGNTINILMEHHKDTLTFGIKENQTIEIISKK
jgi:3D (Asp-Asp-Asp) domain-containing protein